ncbi:MAG: fibronectin type III domain-containing protein [Dorea sp.]
MKKRMRKILVLCSFLLFTLLCEIQDVYAEELQMQTTQETEMVKKKEQNLRITEDEIHILVGDTFQLNVEKDGDGTVVFESNNEEVVAVDEDGMLMACRPGEVIVTIGVEETEEYLAAETTVEVIVDKKTQTIKASNMEFSYGDAGKEILVEVLGDVTLSYSVEDSEIAEVDENGIVTPKKVGKTFLIITASETNEYKEAVCKIQVIVKTTFSKPVFVKVGCEKGVVNLSWEKVEGAKGYYLYEKISGGSYKKIACIDDVDVLNYETVIEKSGTTYSYIIRAYADEGNNISDCSMVGQAKYMLAPTETVRTIKTTVEVKWTQVAGASGYYLYRKLEGTSNWTQIATITSGTTLSWIDKSVTNGKRYYYIVKGYYKDSIGDVSDEKSTLFFNGPSVISLSRKSKSTKMTVKWSRNTAVSGYQIQYATNRLFHKAKTITISNNTTTSKMISKLSKKSTYYVRVRSFVKKMERFIILLGQNLLMQKKQKLLLT